MPFASDWLKGNKRISQAFAAHERKHDEPPPSASRGKSLLLDEVLPLSLIHI